MKCPRPTDTDTLCLGELRPHCPTGQATHPCTWQRCTRCKARVDLPRFRGFITRHDGSSTAFTFPAQ